MSRFSSALEAILLMLLGMACFSAMNIAIRMLSHGMGSTQMVCLRNILSLMIIIAWSTLLQRGLPRFPTVRLKGHFWRASVGFVAMELWFHAVTLMPITFATALSFTTPIFSAIFAILFLGERAGVHRWSAILMGFAGMLIILRPGTGDFSLDAFWVLGSSSVMAVAAILVKTLTRTEPPETIVFYMALFMLLWSIPVAIPNWQPFTAHQLGLVCIIALCSTAAHLLMARAYVRADMVMLMPFDFTRLIFTAMLAYPFFGETMDFYTVLGSAIIVASTVYIAHREARKKQLPPKQTSAIP